ncbi:MAG: FAD-binding oxidoreductase [Pseudomonadota bacterium]
MLRTNHQPIASDGAAVESHLETGLPNYTQQDLAAFGTQISGTAVPPGSAGYNDARMVFMHTYQQYPQLIVNCAVYRDVIAALDFAKKHDLKVTSRSGGHSTAGYSSNDQMLIDVSGIDHVLIDPVAKTARVGAGANFRKLNMMLDVYGLHVPGGGCETVCVAGYMMGGGYGFTSRLFGMNCDHVRAVTLVAVEGSPAACEGGLAGRIVRASETENPDLYWAVRGGTGNQFGILVEIEYDLRPVDDFWAFGLRWRIDGNVDRISQIIAAFQEHYTNGGSPATIGLQGLMMNIPTESGDDHARDQIPQFLIRGLCSGSEQECFKALGPLLEFCDPDCLDLQNLRKKFSSADPQDGTCWNVDLWHCGPYLTVNEQLLTTSTSPPQDMPTVSLNTKPLVSGRIIGDRHDAASWVPMIEHFLNAPDKTTFLAMEAYGGAVNVPAPDAMAYMHRDASMDLFTWVFWTFQDHEIPAREWLDGFEALSGRLSNGHRYQNYPKRGNAEFRREYWGANFDRLLRIKHIWDPGNLLAYEQSISPELP